MGVAAAGVAAYFLRNLVVPSGVGPHCGDSVGGGNQRSSYVLSLHRACTGGGMGISPAGVPKNTAADYTPERGARKRTGCRLHPDNRGERDVAAQPRVADRRIAVARCHSEEP